MPEFEFLIRHPKPSSDFTSLGYDAVLKSEVYYRRRTFPPYYLATFPAVSGSSISTIVVGQAENTSAKTSTPWVVTLLHEHFHQLQNSQPNYFADVNALNLSHGDQTGMWMLNYAFPYEREDVQQQFEAMSSALATALNSRKADRARSVRKYLEARRNFQQLVSADDNKYLAFQLWQEGIARYTEYKSRVWPRWHIVRAKSFSHLRTTDRMLKLPASYTMGLCGNSRHRSWGNQSARLSIHSVRLRVCCWIKLTRAGSEAILSEVRSG